MEVPTRYSEQVVFKCRFCYYSGTVKPTIGMIAVGKLVGDSPFLRGGGCQAMGATWRSTRLVRRQRGLGKTW